MKEIKLKVDGMHCSSCVTLIKDELDEIKGIRMVKVDLKSGIVSFSAEDHIKPDKIIATIKDLGYEAKIV